MLQLEELICLAEQIDTDLFGEVRTSNLLKYLSEEVEELREAGSKLQTAYSAKDKLNQSEEFGDILFCLISYARQQNIDLREALTLTIIKLQDRLKIKNRDK